MVLLRLSLPLLDTLSIRTARACILLRSTVARVLRRRIALWLVLIVRSRHYRIAARLLLSLTILLLIYSRRTTFHFFFEDVISFSAHAFSFSKRSGTHCFSSTRDVSSTVK